MKSLSLILVYLFLTISSQAQTPVLDWAKSIGGTGIDMGYSISFDASGNVYVGGRFEGAADFDPGPGTFNMASTGSNDIFVLKLNASGDFVWAKNMGSSGDDQCLSIALDVSGNVYTTGWFQNTADFDPGPATFTLTSNGSFDVFVSKLDTDGNFIWAKSIGSTDGDVGRSLSVDALGNVYVSGFYSGTADFDPGTSAFNLTSIGPDTDDTFILKLDASGNFVWAKSMGGNDNGDDGYSITTDATGNIYTAGSYELTADFDPGAGVYNLTSAGGQDIFVSKLDASGNFEWARSIGEASDDNALSVKVDTDGNVYTSGFFSEATDFDPGTGTFTLTPSGGEDIFVLKLDPSGNFSWAKNMGGEDDDHSFSLALDADGNAYTTGYFEGTADFDPGSGTFDLTATNSSRDIFISKLDSSGNFEWAISIGGTSLDQGYAIVLDPSGNIYTTGYYLFTADFDPGPGIFNVTYTGTAPNNSDGFILKLSNSGPALSITNFTPSSGPVGTNVTINGTNFSTIPGGNVVKFNGTTAVVSTSTATSINTTVPVAATTGAITVTVAGNTATSASSFTVTTSQGNQPPVIAASVASVPIGGIVTVDLLPLISDADNDLDISTLSLVTSVSEQGAAAMINASSQLVLDYDGVQFYGTDNVTIAVCDLIPNCVEQQLTVEVTGDLIIYNAVSPDSNGLNDIFLIEFIDVLQNTVSNRVTIFNRWGDAVFEISDYNNDDRVFTGQNTNGSELPSGTYYYRIEFSSGRKSITGYLSLRR